MAEQTVAQLEQWAVEHGYAIEVDAKANGSWVVTLAAEREPLKFTGQTSPTTQSSVRGYVNALTIAVGKARGYDGRLGR